MSRPPDTMPADSSSLASGLQPSRALGDMAPPRKSITPATTYHSAGYYKSYFEDPVGLDVNSVRNGTDWYWNYICVSNPYGSYAYGWYSPSGWRLRDNNWSNTYNCDRTHVTSYVHYSNGVFCATIDTHTYYNRNHVYGWYDGWLLGAVTWQKSGGCTYLLSFHAFLRRTLN